MKKISIITPCYNEEDNVFNVYTRVKAVFSGLSNYTYEHIFIDNASTDKTVNILKEIAKTDHNIKIIVNARNFGHIRSPYHALLQSNGNAAVMLPADLQEPPELIIEFIHYWEEGYDIVAGVKPKSKESRLMFFIRKLYYSLITKLSEVDLIKNFTGFGLYDRKVIDTLRELNEPEPYLRGLISELGFSIKVVPYIQAVRKSGVSKNNFYTLYDLAMLGFTNHSKLPLRIATFLGFTCSFMSFIVAILFLIAKLIWWSRFTLGMAPLMIGLFFLGSVQLFCIGILGEYIAVINTRITNRPHVIEKERINFES